MSISFKNDAGSDNVGLLDSNRDGNDSTLNGDVVADTWRDEMTEYTPVLESEVQAPGQPPASDSRLLQMAAIRKILSDVEEDIEEDAGDAPEIETPAASVAPEPSMHKRAWDDENDSDQLASQIDDLTRAVRAAKPLPALSGYDALKLRRSHETRVKKLQRAKDRREKSGAFLAGFTLVSTVTAAMVSLYVMHPQIIAASPKMAPAINEYVETVDRYRFEGNETAAVWTAWLAERISKISGKMG